MAYCGTFPGTCGKKHDCADTHCPGREYGRHVQMYTQALEIADEAARCDVECIAAGVPSTYDMPVYDLSRIEPGLPQDDDMQLDYRVALDKAVQYLDLRGLLVRPWPHMHWIVAFRRRT